MAIVIKGVKAPEKFGRIVIRLNAEGKATVVFDTPGKDIHSASATWENAEE